MRRQLHFTRMSRLEALSNVHMIIILIQFPSRFNSKLRASRFVTTLFNKAGKFPHPPTQYRRPPFLILFQDSTVLWTLANGDPVPSRRLEYYNTIQEEVNLRPKKRMICYSYTVTIRSPYETRIRRPPLSPFSGGLGQGLRARAVKRPRREKIICVPVV